MANISDFKAHLIGGGARPNQFYVELSFPTWVTAAVSGITGQRAQFMCKAASLPASTIENIPLQYRGRAVNIAGERTFAPWTITIYNDVDFGIRNAMEEWSDGIQQLATTRGITNPSGYQVDLKVHQLARDGNIVKTYVFKDAYPTEVGTIALDFDQANSIETFDVTFQYNYWTSDTPTKDSVVSVNSTLNTPLGSFPIG